MNHKFTSAKDFRSLIEHLYRRASQLEAPELEDFASAESYIQQSYEGRSLFELIQNGRDAAYLAQEPCQLDIELEERPTGHWLVVRNSGLPFTPAGLEGLTRIGQSSKNGVHTIGFKGIGFKAVKQLTDTPRIVTRWGTLYFDVARSRSQFLSKKGPAAPSRLPLFRLPHYAVDSLTTAELARGVATRVELPLRNDEAWALVEADLAGLTAQQLVFLGWVQRLVIRTPKGITAYKFVSQAAGRLEVMCNGEVTEQYRVFEPETDIRFPTELLSSVSAEEQAIMERMTRIDIRVLLLLDKRSRFISQEEALLYLYYPLRLRSGFRFLIHSFFLVDPARTTLRPQCRPNDFLLQQIGQFIGREMLAKLVAGGYDTTEILYYQRRKSPEVRLLHDEVQQQLRHAAFIRLPRVAKAPRYLRPDEAMCAAPWMLKLLPSGRVAERQLVPVADAAVRRWLREEFDVPELTAANLGQQLELECIRQSHAGNISFFQQLYEFLATDKTLELGNYRLLLTQQRKVVAGGQEPVFYRTQATAQVSLARPLQSKLHLLHSALKLTEAQLRALKDRTGVQELKPDALAEQLLTLSENEELSALRAPILRALKDLAQAPEQVRAWFPRVWLPVQGERWVLPLQQPVYVERAELRELYPNGLFVDRSWSDHLTGNMAEWDAFLLQVGAWDKPGLYINPKSQELTAQDPRNGQIRGWKGWNTKLMLFRDRLLHVPAQPTAWFTQQILAHWAYYHGWLSRSYDQPFVVRSVQSSYWHQPPTEYVPEWCSAVHWLRTATWVVLPGQPARAISHLVGLGLGSTRMRLADSFLPVWRLDPEQHQNFIAVVRLNHFSARHLSGRAGMEMMRRVLRLTHDLYPDLTSVPAPDFEAFYNALLLRLEEFWEELVGPESQQESLQPFRNEPWLARVVDTGRLEWHPAYQLLHLDDKLAYEQLLRDLRNQSAAYSQLPASFYYHFTKRDAQGFGRLAQHLGQPFSSLVRRTLQQVPEETPEPLLTNSVVSPDLLLRLVALLEGQRRRQFSQAEITRLHGVQLVHCASLVVTFQLAFAGRTSKVEFELEQPSFLARGGRPNRFGILYVQQAAAPATPAQAQRNVAEALVALLAQVLDASGHSLRQTLPNLLAAFGQQDFEEFDSLHNLSADRLADLRTELYPPLEAPEAQFWKAVRRALGLPALLLTGTAPVAELLAGIPLAPDSALPVQLGEAFTGGTLPEQANTRALLLQLLQEIGLSIADLNAQLPQPLHFAQLLDSEWQLALEGYKAHFAGCLHAGLTLQPSLQAQYLNKLRKYEQLPRPAALHEWQPDHNAQLQVLCAHLFKEELAPAALPPPRDGHTQSKRTLEALRRQFGKTTEEAEQLDTFLQVPARRSLLYFGQQTQLATDFVKWQRKRQDAEDAANPTANATPPINPAGFDQPIGNMVAPSVPLPRNHSGGGGTGGAVGGHDTQQARDRIGRRAEERVWVWLREQGYRNVTWVSANARRVAVRHPAYNLQGSDDHHYDIHYTDVAGERVFVEVKGTSGNSLDFYMSRAELEFAERQLPGRYRLFFVTQALDDQHCCLYPLENPFHYSGSENRWYNSRFRAESDTVQISFQIQYQ